MNLSGIRASIGVSLSPTIQVHPNRQAWTSMKNFLLLGKNSRDRKSVGKHPSGPSGKKEICPMSRYPYHNHR
jgi:hypothetical protein